MQEKNLIYLCSQRFSENKDITDDRRVRDNELIRLADSGRYSADCAPGVHHRLPAGHSCARLKRAILESAHNQRNDNIALLLCHLGGDGEQHQHIVALGDTHGVEVREYISTRNFPLNEENIFVFILLKLMIEI